VNIRFFIFSIILWIYLFGGVYYVGSIMIYPQLIFAILGLGILLLRGKIEIKFIYFVFILLAFILLFGQFFNKSIEPTKLVLIQFIRTIILPILGGFFLYRILRKLTSFKQFVICLSFALLFQTILSLFQFFSPSFRTLFFSFIHFSPSWQAFVDLGHFRATGLAGLSIYDSSIAYALLLLSIIPLAKSNVTSSNVLALWVIFLSIPLLFISGRTGLIFSFLIIAYTMCIFAKKSLLLYFFLVTFFTLFTLFQYLDMDLDSFAFIIDLALEPFINLMSGKGFSSASTGDLMDNHLFIPEGINPLYGGGEWLQKGISSRSDGTDSGLVLLFAYSGVFGVLLAFIIVFGYAFFYSKSFLVFAESKGNLLFYGSFVVFFGYFTFCLIKAPFFFQEKIMSASVFLYIIQKLNRSCYVSKV
jgi:hypothetical protein